MPKACNIELNPEQILDQAAIQRLAARKLGLRDQDISTIKILRRSIDARRVPKYIVQLEVFLQGEPIHHTPYTPIFKQVRQAPEVHIAGTGPAGLFAALRLLEMGYKPVLLERGKEVRDRRRDLALLNRQGLVHPDSNYCFGEGGAGTFSDGKLYTRSTKRGDVKDVLHKLVYFGADLDILVDAHPHIGTNKLPQLIEAMRACILQMGGEIHFNTRLTDLRLQDEQITQIQVNGDTWIPIRSLILATGHSAGDIYRLLHNRNIALHAKPFALGVRVEHPQELIDKIQYKTCPRNAFLPPAAYSWVKQVGSLGVYSFCMCPGGIICPSATSQDEIVVNGWSPSKRNNPYANSGIVVQISPADLGLAADDPLAILSWREKIERKAAELGGGKQVAPAQRLVDFIRGKVSQDLPTCSYIPGVASVDLRAVLPPLIANTLKKGFELSGQSLKGYLSNEAIIVGVESRTSSPVRIPRNEATCAHLQLSNLYPCGEGAGYAGGIVSAALDGVKCAEKAAIRQFEL